MNQPVNKTLLDVAAAAGLTPEQVHDCAEKWKAVYCVDFRKPLPADMAHLDGDFLRRLVLRRILESYKTGLGKRSKRGR